MEILPLSPTKSQRTEKIVQQLEATFWAELLKSSKAFEYQSDGGIGTQQFQSFMIEQQSQILARSHPLGLGAAVMDTLDAKDRR